MLRLGIVKWKLNAASEAAFSDSTLFYKIDAVLQRKIFVRAVRAKLRFYLIDPSDLFINDASWVRGSINIHTFTHQTLTCDDGRTCVYVMVIVFWGV